MEAEANIQIQINLKINRANPETLQALQEFINKINSVNQQQPQHEPSIEEQIREATANFNTAPASVQALVPAPVLIPSLECDKCGRKFFSLGKLGQHKKGTRCPGRKIAKLPLTETCPRCGRGFTSPRRLQRHIGSGNCKPRVKPVIPEGILRKCIDCGLEARTEKDLEQFVTSKKQNYGRLNLCKECRRKQLKKYSDAKPKKPPHELVGKGHTCPNCGSSRLYGNGYRQDTHERCFVCRDCGKSFTDKTEKLKETNATQPTEPQPDQKSEPKKKSNQPIPPEVKCKFCGGRNIHRYGSADGKTVYMCNDCGGRRFRWPVSKIGRKPSLPQVPVKLEKTTHDFSPSVAVPLDPTHRPVKCPKCRQDFIPDEAGQIRCDSCSAKWGKI